MRNTTLIFIMAGLCLEVFAQPNLDSLYTVWKDEERPDSIRAKAYEDYLWSGYVRTEPDSAFLLAEALMTFAETHDLPMAKAMALRVQGASHNIRGNYAKAISYFEKAIVVCEGSGYKEGKARCLDHIGTCYFQQGNYPKALDYLQQALALSEELGNEKIMASALNSLGGIYQEQGDYAKALEYFRRSLASSKEMGNKRMESYAVANIGLAYRYQKDNANALDFFQQGLALFEELGDVRSYARTLHQIGNILSEQGDIAKALEHHQRGLALMTELGEKGGMSISLYEIGSFEMERGEHERALEYCRRAFTLAQEAGILEEQRDACRCLYNTYKAMGKGNEALRYLERMRVLDDSLQAEETVKKLEQMEFNRQIYADSVAKAEKARLIESGHQEEIRRKNRTRNYLVLSGLGLLVVAGGLYSRARYMRRSRDLISKERDRSENLLLNILPSEVAEELKEKGRAEARDFEMVSILFTDFKGFTQASEKMSAAELVREINTCFEAFDGIVGKHGIEKIKTIGDAYMAAGGLPVPDVNAARNTVLAGLEMQAFIQTRHAERSVQGLPAFEMRVGIHTGPVVAGIVGVKKFQYDIWGDTVNTASRMESSGEVGQVNISEATYAQVKNETGLTFTPRGKVQAKGKGEMEMYFVEHTLDPE